MLVEVYLKCPAALSKMNSRAVRGEEVQSQVELVYLRSKMLSLNRLEEYALGSNSDHSSLCALRLLP